MDEPFTTRREFETFKEREFDTFRNDVVEDLKWLRRFLIAALIAAIGGPLVSSMIALFTRQPP